MIYNTLLRVSVSSLQKLNKALTNLRDFYDEY